MSVDRSYTFPDGTTVTLKPVPSMVVEHILNSESGKPAVPTQEVMRPNGKSIREPNPHDPEYVSARALWEAEKQKRVLLFIVNRGIEEYPPDELATEYATYLPPGASEDEIKYLWVAFMLGNESEEVARLTEAIMSQTIATPAGVAEALDAFRSDSERGADIAVSIQEAADGTH